MFENRGDGIPNATKELVIGDRCLDRTGLIEVLADAARGRQGTIEGADDVRDDNGFRGTGQLESAVGTPAREHEVGRRQLAQDLLEKGGRDLEALRDLLAFAPLALVFGNGQKGQAPVFAGSSHAHFG